MPSDLPIEAERLLADLPHVDNAVAFAREQLARVYKRLEAPFVERIMRASPDQLDAVIDLTAKELRALVQGKHRSELAALAGDLVFEERRRAQIMRELEAFPQFAEAPPAVDIAVEHDGERGFTIRICGQASHFKLPAIIDRGVWRGDGRYERGDAVTCDGSLWIAREDNPSHEPGKGPQWRLAVTKGKNGRDAKFAGRG